MRPATAVAKEVPHIETHEQVNFKGAVIPDHPVRKDSRLQRVRKILQVLEQVVVGEILAITLSKNPFD